MTRTTELLKGCGRGSYPHFCGEKIKGISNSGDLCPECKSELKGRLDALKEELLFLEGDDIIGCIIEADYGSCHEIPKWYLDRLASIQEEIKLIERKI